MIGTVAQWLEQVTHNLRVAGSSPAGSTNPPHFPNYRRLPGSSIKKIWNIPFLPDSKSGFFYLNLPQSRYFCTIML